MMDVDKGATRVRTWPKKRGRAKTPEEAERREWFRQAQWSAKFADPKCMDYMARATKGTPLLPRDIWTMMLAGRWMGFMIEGKGLVVSEIAQFDVSLSLDTLSKTPGWILQRGPDRWYGAPPIVANRAGAIVSNPANQHSNNDGVYRALAFTAEELDQALFWNIAAPSNIVIPVTGWYSVTLNVSRANSNAAVCDAAIFQNAVERATVRMNHYSNFAAERFVVQANLYCTAGDIVQARVKQTGAAAFWSNAVLTIVGNA